MFEVVQTPICSFCKPRSGITFIVHGKRVLNNRSTLYDHCQVRKKTRRCILVHQLLHVESMHDVAFCITHMNLLLFLVFFPIYFFFHFILFYIIKCTFLYFFVICSFYFYIFVFIKKNTTWNCMDVFQLNKLNNCSKILNYTFIINLINSIKCAFLFSYMPLFLFRCLYEVEVVTVKLALEKSTNDTVCFVHVFNIIVIAVNVTLFLLLLSEIVFFFCFI